MPSTQTAFDLLLRTADELDITVISGHIWPIWDGQQWFGDQSLWQILLPDGEPRTVALAVVASGPGTQYIRTGRGTLDAERTAQLAHVVAEAGGYLYQGRLAWRHPPKVEPHADIDAEAGSIASPDAWPANLAGESALFLDNQPIVNLLAKESAGRTATILVGDTTG